MRLFVSYARLDKPYCIQINNLLSAHELWFDQRFYAGERWWDEILRRLEWCEGFIYLLSPASVASEYCRKEFNLAVQLQRHIFPILIHDQTTIPDEVAEYQYVDLSRGLTPDTTALLLNSIHHTEINARPKNVSLDAVPRAQVELPVFNSASVISVAAAAMEKGQFDQAVFLFKQAKAKGFTSRFINIDKLLREAERQLEEQTKSAQRDLDYRQIAALIHAKTTHEMGCEALVEFMKEYPTYDPENLCGICGCVPATNGALPVSVTTSGSLPTGVIQTALPAAVPVRSRGTAQTADFTLPMLEWAPIPEGNVIIEDVDNNKRTLHTMFVRAYEISRYPVTNQQYKAFLDDPNGYAQERWWAFSAEAKLWRSERPNPQPGKFDGDDRPRETVSWFDALAFCNWLSDKLGEQICLPASEHWFRAARGDTDLIYPWGSTFDREFCNTSESELKMTTPVTRYPKGVSQFGVWDMAGNVWEWAISNKHGATEGLNGYIPRAVHGGAFHSEADRARIPFRYYLNPRVAHASIGFRLVRRWG